MSLRRVLRPETLPVTVDELKLNEAITHDLHDLMLERLIRAALAAAEKRCGRAFGEQVWEVVLDAFPAHEIELPFGPAVEVLSVTYIDPEGLPQTVDPGSYRVDTVSRDGWLVPVAGWPATMSTINAVTVRYKLVGVEPADDDVRQAIILMAGHWYAHREASSETSLSEIPMGALWLLDHHRRIYI